MHSCSELLYFALQIDLLSQGPKLLILVKCSRQAGNRFHDVLYDFALRVAFTKDPHFHDGDHVLPVSNHGLESVRVCGMRPLLTIDHRARQWP